MAIYPHIQSAAGTSHTNYGWSSQDDHNPFRNLVRYDKKLKKDYIQFKYYGEYDILSRIKEDVIDELFFMGLSVFDNSPIFRFYFDNQQILEKVKRNELGELNILLRRLKLKVFSNKASSHEKSVYTFFNFLSNSMERFLIKSAPDNECKN